MLTQSPLKIVIVEDNAETNHLLQEWLKLKFSVIGYLDAESALRQLIPSPDPIVFLLDYNLPGANGIQLKEDLAPLFPQAKYILISGLFDETLMETARQAGFHSLVPKPFAMPTITKKVEELFGVEKHSLLDVIRQQN